MYLFVDVKENFVLNIAMLNLIRVLMITKQMERSIWKKQIQLFRFRNYPKYKKLFIHYTIFVIKIVTNEICQIYFSHSDLLK